MNSKIILLALSIFMSTPFFGQVLSDSLIAHYPFNGNALDVSGNNNHGTNFGAFLTSNRFGEPNSAYAFDGVSNYIDLNNDFDLPIRTLNLWVNIFDVPSIELHVFVSDNPSMNHGFTQVISNTILGDTVLRSSACNFGAVANNLIQLDTWHMITICVDPESVKHFYDGELVNTTSLGTETSNSGHPTALLGTSRLFDRYFLGRIDDVRIYNRCLSADEITELYTEPLIVSDFQIEDVEVKLFPNPSSDRVNLEVLKSNNEKFDLFVFDEAGALKYSLLNINTNRVTFSTQELSSGIHIVELISNKEVFYSGKITIQ